MPHSPTRLRVHLACPSGPVPQGTGLCQGQAPAQGCRMTFGSAGLMVLPPALSSEGDDRERKDYPDVLRGKIAFLTSPHCASPCGGDTSSAGRSTFFVPSPPFDFISPGLTALFFIFFKDCKSTWPGCLKARPCCTPPVKTKLMLMLGTGSTKKAPRTSTQHPKHSRTQKYRFD